MAVSLRPKTSMLKSRLATSAVRGVLRMGVVLHAAHFHGGPPKDNSRLRVPVEGLGNLQSGLTCLEKIRARLTVNGLRDMSAAFCS